VQHTHTHTHAHAHTNNYDHVEIFRHACEFAFVLRQRCMCVYVQRSVDRLGCAIEAAEQEMEAALRRTTDVSKLYHCHDCHWLLM